MENNLAYIQVMMKMNNEYALLIDMVQKELCINCHVYEYTNRDCSKCPNNLEERLKDESV